MSRKINSTESIKDATIELLSYYNALDFEEEAKFIQLSCDPPKGIESIAYHLCGTEGYELAVSFMNGEDCIKEFLENVSHCDFDKIPFVAKAINIRLDTIKTFEAKRDVEMARKYGKKLH